MMRIIWLWSSSYLTIRWICTHTRTLTYRVITVIPTMVARLHFTCWVAYMHFDDLSHFTDQFNILHATIIIHSWILNFKVKLSHFEFSKVKITNIPSSKRLRLLVCHILHTLIQYCTKTISVAIRLRHNDMMTGLPLSLFASRIYQLHWKWREAS